MSLWYKLKETIAVFTNSFRKLIKDIIGFMYVILFFGFLLGAGVVMPVLMLSMAYNALQLQLDHNIAEAKVLQRYIVRQGKGTSRRMSYQFEVQDPLTGGIHVYFGEDHEFYPNRSTVLVMYAPHNPAHSAVLTGSYPFVEIILPFVVGIFYGSLFVPLSFVIFFGKILTILELLAKRILIFLSHFGFWK